MKNKTNKITFTHPGITKILQLIPINTKSLLDLGCGRGIIGILTRIYRYNIEKMVGVDIFNKYINFCRKHRIYDQIIKWDLRNLPLPFIDKSFDVVTLIEVVEHLPKALAINLIHEAERIAKKRVILSTPNGAKFSMQELCYDNNPFQKHLCYFTVKELKKMGYVCYTGAQFYFFNIQIPFILTLSEPTKRKFVSISKFLNSILIPFSSNIIAVKDLI